MNGQPEQNPIASSLGEIIDWARPWLLKEVDPEGRAFWTVRAFFWAVQGPPRYFGPFTSQEEAEAFYEEALDFMAEAVCELMHLAGTIDLRLSPVATDRVVGEA